MQSSYWFSFPFDMMEDGSDTGERWYLLWNLIFLCLRLHYHSILNVLKHSCSNLLKFAVDLHKYKHWQKEQWTINAFIWVTLCNSAEP